MKFLRVHQSQVAECETANCFYQDWVNEPEPWSGLIGTCLEVIPSEDRLVFCVLTNAQLYLSDVIVDLFFVNSASYLIKGIQTARRWISPLLRFWWNFI